MGWFLLQAALLAAAAVTIWRRPGIGSVGSFAFLYAFYQASSLNYLVPRELYKDGGNGTLADWLIWVVWAAVCIAILLLLTGGLKRLSKGRQRLRSTRMH